MRPLRPISAATSTATQTVNSETANRVLRNTYFLLSLTLLVSAAMAAYAITTNATPVGFVIQLVGMFGLLFLTMALRNSAWGVLSIFLFTAFTGYTLGPTLNMYIHGFSNGSQMVMTALGATGLIFASLSGYVLTTRKDFSFLGGVLFIALITAVVISIAAMVFNLAMTQVVISGAFAVIFSGYILYDTSQIIHGGQTNYIMATVSLYLDILNLFLALLRLLSFFSGGSRN